MARKGERGMLEPQAERLFADGKGVPEIASILQVSETTLYKWKSDSLVPGDELDGWEKTRLQKRSNILRLRSLFERELGAAEETPEGLITAASIDALTKLGALVQRWEAVERAAADTENQVVEIDRPTIFLENLEWLALQLKEYDPEGLKALGKNFDFLIIKYKAEHEKKA